MQVSPILGVAGLDKGGKTTVSRLLKARGFHHVSLSDMIREEATSRGLDHKTETLIKLGQEMCAKEGNDILAQRALKQIESNKPYIVDSIRRPEEVLALMEKAKFILLSVDAPFYTRFKRFNHAKREGETVTLKEFAERDELAFYTPGDNGQQTGVCMGMAEYKLLNFGVGTDDKMQPYLDKILKAIERPDWIKYFMSVADVAKRRSTCDRLHAGAVIWNTETHDTISTGYNGSPPGRPHCDEAGHEMEEGHCIRTRHAEENALAHVRDKNELRNCAISSTALPCYSRCYKAIISAGIKEIHYDKAYRKDERIFEDAQKHGIILKQVSLPKHKVFGID